MKKLLSFLFIFAASGLLFGQDICFDRELIEIKVTPGNCKLTGIYFMISDPGNQQSQILLKYPFPVSDSQPFPTNITVTNMASDTPIQYRENPEDIFFAIPIAPGKTSCFQVNCLQPVQENRFEYILTTTLAWHRPLTKADFQITIPKELELVSISLEYDSVKTIESQKIYYITKRNFMPRKNLILKWREDHE